MSGTANLAAPYVVAAQNSKEVTANAAFDRLDAAITETFEANVTAGNVTLTTAQYQACMQVRAINATTVGRTVTLPQVERITILRNDPANTQSVGFVRGSTTLTLAVGETVIARTDGTTNGLVALLRGTGSGGGGSTIVVEDEGTTVSGGPHGRINFAGAGVSVADAGGGEVTVTIAGGGSGITLEDEGTTVTGGPHTTLNFVGSGVSVANAGGGEATVTISGGGGGGGNQDGRTHVVPTLTDFTWVNQGAAVATQRTYGVSVSAPGGTGDNLRLLVRSAPSTPYEIRMRAKSMVRRGNFASYCMCWRDSATGRIVAFNPVAGLAVPLSAVKVNYWTDATTFSSEPLSVGDTYVNPDFEWTRIRDDGTNFLMDTSIDGDTWYNWLSVGRTAFLASPNQVGFGVLPIQPGGTLRDTNICVLSWEAL